MYRTSSTRPMADASRSRAPQGGAGVAAQALARRERDFGVGYGRSSGYTTQRSYVASQPAYFRCR